MKILHMIGGGDVGGAKTHVLSLVQKLSETNDVLLVSFRSGEFADEAKSLGIKTKIIKNRNPLRDIRELRELVINGSFDIIHCHGAKANVMGALIKYVCNAPLITTVHSDYRLDYLGNFIKRCTNGLMNTVALRFLDAYIGVTNIFADMMISRGFDPYKLFTLNNGIDFDIVPSPSITREDYLKSLGITPCENTVICGIAARLHPVKDIGTAIRAVASLRKSCPELYLIIGGEGEDEARLRALTDELGISSHVKFAGWINDMDSFLGAVDISIISSLSEGFPYSILESARARCTMVSTEVGAMATVIDHGVNGLLFQPRDEKKLSEHLKFLYENADDRREMADRLFEKSRVEYSFGAMVSAQLAIYDRVIALRGRNKHRDQIVVCGSYGRGNAGDDAILQAVTSEIYKVDNGANICVMSRNPKQTRLRYRVRSVYTFSIFRIFSSLCKSHLYINGGGSLIQDSTSSRSLYFYLFTLIAAKICGCRVMMYGCGIGPVKRPINRKIAGRIIDRYVDSITLRDPASLSELRNMHVSKPEMHLAADPTLELISADDFRIKGAFFKEGLVEDEKYLCLAMRNWRGIDEKLDIFASVADYATKEYGLKIVLMPMERKKDLPIAERICEKMSESAVIIRGEYDVHTVIGLLSRMNIIMAMRLHALVFGAGQGVPTIGIAYDHKVSGFMDYIGREMCVLYDDCTLDKLKNFIDRTVKDTEYSEHMQRACRQMRENEIENINALRKFF